MVDFNNRRQGMILFQIWVSPQELEFLLNSKDGEKINQLLNEIKDRKDIV
jgi:hypothetical protein